MPRADLCGGAGHVVTEYESHLKQNVGFARNLCDRQTVGLLQRRHIKVDQIKTLQGSNSLESVDEGWFVPNRMSIRVR